MPARSRRREQFLADIIVGAVEGGTGYWAQVSGYHWSDDEPAETRATLHDMEDSATFALTIEDIARGLAMIVDERGEFRLNDQLRSSIVLADRENDGGYIDADCADVIAQAACFGEVVYG
jgi:hypothetical protein